MHRGQDLCWKRSIAFIRFLLFHISTIRNKIYLHVSRTLEIKLNSQQSLFPEHVVFLDCRRVDLVRTDVSEEGIPPSSVWKELAR
jgi:hypothetical protein